MIQTNTAKSVQFVKKGFKWALVAALIGAVIGLFAGCMTTPDTVYDTTGPCLSGKLEYRDSRYDTYTARDTPANRVALLEQGYKIVDCKRQATSAEMSERSNDRAVFGLVSGAIVGGLAGCALPWLAAAWFFFLVLLGQMFGAVRAEPIQANHRVTVKVKRRRNRSESPR